VAAISQRDLGFSRLAQKNGFINKEQSDKILTLLIKARDEFGDHIGFEDLAVEAGFMTNQQATAISLAYQRLMKDAEKKKMSISGYELFNKVGEGGLGVVWKARQISMNRIVALKILHKRWLNDEEFKQRFLIEARLVGKLSHQNLIKVFDVGKEDWRYYYSMEFIEGETVEEMIEREGPLDVLKAIDIAMQILRAIKYLQRYEIVHCDIKPSNIIVMRDGVAKLGDFGFVKSNIELSITEEGSVLGTPDYISPEQALGMKNVDFRSDIYSLGVTLYHMLAKKPPFDGSVSTIMRKHIKASAPSLKNINPSLPERLCRIIDRMMAKDPKERHQSCDDIFEELELVKLQIKTGKDLSASAAELVSAIKREKDRGFKQQIEKLEISQQLKKMIILFWISTSLFGLCLVLCIYLLILLRRANLL
jgi:serine/threonine-protein kinase